MEQRFWWVDTEKKYKGLTSFRLQSIVCFLLILFSTFLFRLSIIAWAVSARCVESDQFWFIPHEQHWPLAANFFFVFSLLLVWNISIFVSQFMERRVDVTLFVVNLIALVALLSMTGPVLDTSQIRHDIRTERYGAWNVSQPLNWWWGEDECVLARDYVGNWTVVERDIPEYGAPFPVTAIELRQSLRFRASDSRWTPVVEGYWRPPNFSSHFDEDYRGVGEIYHSHGVSLWKFELEGDRLTLTTPEFVDWYLPSTVVLERVSGEDHRFFPRRD